MECVNAFTIPIYKFKFADHQRYKPKFMEYLLDESVFKENTVPGSNLKFTSPNLDMNELFQPFVSFACENVSRVMNELGYKPDIQMTGLWATKQVDNGGHHRHSHGNSFLAGVYYLHGNITNVGTTFHAPYNHTQIVPAKNGNPLVLAKSRTTFFEEGTLYIFPAWLEHGTGLNRMSQTQSERYILSFNTLPVGMTNHDPFDRYNYIGVMREDMVQTRKETIPGL